MQVLHLLAIARSAGVALELDDFQASSDRTPFLADLKPSGRFVMEDVHKARRAPSLNPSLMLLGLVHGVGAAHSHTRAGRWCIEDGA